MQVRGRRLVIERAQRQYAAIDHENARAAMDAQSVPVKYPPPDPVRVDTTSAQEKAQAAARALKGA